MVESRNDRAENAWELGRMQRSRPAWSAKIKLRLTLDCSKFFHWRDWLPSHMIFLAKFVVSRYAFCRLGKNFQFFCSVNHRRGPLRKHKFTCDWCISIHFVCFCVSRFAACDRPVPGNYRLSFLRRFFWSFLFLSLARIKQCLPPALYKKFTHYRDFLRYTLRAKFRRDEYPCYKTDLSWSWLARICPSLTVPMSTLISPILKPRSHIVPNKPERVQAEADN